MILPVIELHPTSAAAAKLPLDPITHKPVSPAWRTTDGPVPQVGNLFHYGQGGCTFQVTKVDKKEVITSEGTTIFYDATIDLT